MHCGQMKMLTLASGLIASVLVFGFMLKVPQVHTQTACDYYASPNGTGNGRSPLTPFQISKFWSVAIPGKTLCLLNGTYTDDNSLIHVPPTFAGTASQPIRIRALNEGKVLIDSGKRRPIDLRGSYGILEGVNVHGGDNSGFAMRGSHWIARRVVIWNNLAQNTNGLLVMAGDHNLVEDCAVFGKARKIVEAGASVGGPSYNTVRRCWGRWESLPMPFGSGAPTEAYEMGYGQSNVTFENVLGIRDTAPDAIESAPEAPFNAFATQNSQWLGSIVYETANANFTTNTLMAVSGAGRADLNQTDKVHLKDIVAIIAQGNPRFGDTSGFVLNVPPDRSGVAENLVAIAGKAGGCSSGWTCSIRHGTTIDAAIGAGKSIWNEVPGICYRYVDGNLTNQPLWPWPMNQRIKDALVQSGRAPVDITATMEQLFGPIPSQCSKSR